MAFSANGTTVSFGGNSLGELTDISFSTEGEKIDVSNLSDTIKIYEVGQSDIECEISVNGHPSASGAVSKGDTGALTITWNDGSTDSITLSLVTSIETSGEVDGKVESTLTLVPTQS